MLVMWFIFWFSTFFGILVLCWTIEPTFIFFADSGITLGHCSDNGLHNLMVIIIFFLSGFSFTDTGSSQDSSGREGTILFHSTTSTRSQTFRHLFATLHVRWLSHIFNRNACIYQTATRWDLPPYWITIWLIDYVILSFVCLYVELSVGFVTAIWHEKPVDSNSHRLSSLYYKRTD